MTIPFLEEELHKMYGKAVYEYLLIESNRLKYHDVLHLLLMNWNKMREEERRELVEKMNRTTEKMGVEFKEWKEKWSELS